VLGKPAMGKKSRPRGLEIGKLVSNWHLNP
jgi:hypothetical protein